MSTQMQRKGTSQRIEYRKNGTVIKGEGNEVLKLAESDSKHQNLIETVRLIAQILLPALSILLAIIYRAPAFCLGGVGMINFIRRRISTLPKE